MKEYYLLAISGLFALPGCVLQSKIAEDMQAHQTAIDSIIAEYERNNGVVLLREFNYAELAAVELPPDTAVVEMLAEAVAQSEQVVHTDTHTITLTPITQADGTRRIKVQAVTKPRKVQAVQATRTDGKRAGAGTGAKSGARAGEYNNETGSTALIENLYLILTIIMTMGFIAYLKKRK
jgi:hypothetical protein